MEYTVVLDGGRPWGIRLTGGRDVGEQVVVTKVSGNSRAAERGVQPGDVVKSINGIVAASLTEAEAVHLLRSTDDRLTLQLVRRNENLFGDRTQQQQQQQQQSSPFEEGDQQQYFSDDGASTSDSQGSIIQVVNGRRRLVTSPSPPPITYSTNTLATTTATTPERRSSLTSSANSNQKKAKQVTFSLPSTTSPTLTPTKWSTSRNLSATATTSTATTDSSAAGALNTMTSPDSQLPSGGTPMSYLTPPTARHASRTHFKDKVLTPFNRPRSPSRDFQQFQMQQQQQPQQQQSPYDVINTQTQSIISVAQTAPSPPSPSVSPNAHPTNVGNRTTSYTSSSTTSAWENPFRSRPATATEDRVSPSRVTVVRMTTSSGSGQPTVDAQRGTTSMTTAATTMTTMAPTGYRTTGTTNISTSPQAPEVRPFSPRQRPIPIIVENYDEVASSLASMAAQSGHVQSSSASSFASAQPTTRPSGVANVVATSGASSQWTTEQLGPVQQRSSSAGSPSSSPSTSTRINMNNVWPPPSVRQEPTQKPFVVTAPEISSSGPVRQDTSTVVRQPDDSNAAQWTSTTSGWQEQRSASGQIQTPTSGVVSAPIAGGWQRNVGGGPPAAAASPNQPVQTSAPSPNYRPFSPGPSAVGRPPPAPSNRPFSPTSNLYGNGIYRSVLQPGAETATGPGTDQSRPLSPATTSTLDQRRPFSPPSNVSTYRSVGQPSGVTVSGFVNDANRPTSPTSGTSVTPEQRRPFSPTSGVVGNGVYRPVAPPGGEIIRPFTLTSGTTVLPNQGRPFSPTSNLVGNQVYRPVGPSSIPGTPGNVRETNRQFSPTSGTTVTPDQGRPFSPTSSLVGNQVYRPVGPSDIVGTPGSERETNLPFSPTSGTTVTPDQGRPFSPTSGLVGNQVYRPAAPQGGVGAPDKFREATRPFSPTSGRTEMLDQSRPFNPSAAHVIVSQVDRSAPPPDPGSAAANASGNANIDRARQDLGEFRDIIGTPQMASYSKTPAFPVDVTPSTGWIGPDHRASGAAAVQQRFGAGPDANRSFSPRPFSPVVVGNQQSRPDPVVVGGGGGRPFSPVTDPRPFSPTGYDNHPQGVYRPVRAPGGHAETDRGNPNATRTAGGPSTEVAVTANRRPFSPSFASGEAQPTTLGGQRPQPVSGWASNAAAATNESASCQADGVQSAAGFTSHTSLRRAGSSPPPPANSMTTQQLASPQENDLSRSVGVVPSAVDVQRGVGQWPSARPPTNAGQLAAGGPSESIDGPADGIDRTPSPRAAVLINRFSTPTSGHVDGRSFGHPTAVPNNAGVRAPTDGVRPQVSGRPEVQQSSSVLSSFPTGQMSNRLPDQTADGSLAQRKPAGTFGQSYGLGPAQSLQTAQSRPFTPSSLTASGPDADVRRPGDGRSAVQTPTSPNTVDGRSTPMLSNPYGQPTVGGDRPGQGQPENRPYWTLPGRTPSPSPFVPSSVSPITLGSATMSNRPLPPADVVSSSRPTAAVGQNQPVLSAASAERPFSPTYRVVTQMPPAVGANSTSAMAAGGVTTTQTTGPVVSPPSYSEVISSPSVYRPLSPSIDRVGTLPSTAYQRPFTPSAGAGRSVDAEVVQISQNATIDDVTRQRLRDGDAEQKTTSMTTTVNSHPYPVNQNPSAVDDVAFRSSARQLPVAQPSPSAAGISPAQRRADFPDAPASNKPVSVPPTFRPFGTVPGPSPITLGRSVTPSPGSVAQQVAERSFSPSLLNRSVTPGPGGYRPVCFSPPAGGATVDGRQKPSAVVVDARLRAGAQTTDGDGTMAVDRPAQVTPATEPRPTAMSTGRLTFGPAGPRRGSDAAGAAGSPSTPAVDRTTTQVVPRPSTAIPQQMTDLTENVVVGANTAQYKPVLWRPPGATVRSASVEPVPASAAEGTPQNSTSTVLRLFGQGKTLDSIQNENGPAQPAGSVVSPAGGSVSVAVDKVTPDAPVPNIGPGTAADMTSASVLRNRPGTSPPWLYGTINSPGGDKPSSPAGNGLNGSQHGDYDSTTANQWTANSRDLRRSVTAEDASNGPAAETRPTADYNAGGPRAAVMSPPILSPTLQEEKNKANVSLAPVGNGYQRSFGNRPVANNVGHASTTGVTRSLMRPGSAGSNAEAAKKESKFGKPTLFYGGIGPRDEHTGVPIALRNTITDRHKKDWYKQMYSVLHKPLTDDEDRQNSVTPTNEGNETSGYSGRIEDYVPGQSRANRINGHQRTKKTNLRMNVESDTEAEYRKRDMQMREPSPACSDIVADPQRAYNYRSWTLQRPSGHNMRQASASDATAPSRFDNNYYDPDRTLTRSSTLDSRRPLANNNNNNRDFSNYRDDDVIYSNTSLPRRSASSLPYSANHSNMYDENHWMRLISDDESSRDDRSSQYAGSVSSICSRDSDARSLQRPPPDSQPLAVYGKARALYSFRAQNSRELSFKRGDVIHLTRQIDKNWYEGRLHGIVGIIPVNYIEILRSIEDARSLASTREGQARAKYNFSGQTPLELSFRKGDVLRLIRQVDANWYEGRTADGARSGIFPINYVETIVDPQSQMATPMSSLAPSPLPGGESPGYVSPVSSISGPTRPSAPMSPADFDQFDGDIFDFGPVSATRPVYGRPPSRNDRPTAGGVSSNIAAAVRAASTTPGPIDHQFDQFQTSDFRRQQSLDHTRNVMDELNERLRQGRMSSSGGGLDGGGGSGGSVYRRPASAGRTTTDRVQNAPPLQKHSLGGSSGVMDNQQLMRNLRVFGVENLVNGDKPSRHGNGIDNIRSNYPLYRALYNYNPRNDDELALREDDVIEVMERCDDGWYVGQSRTSNEFGTFPGNYVEKI